MTEIQTCPDCGSPLVPGKPCAACLLGVGLESLSQEPGSRLQWTPPTVEELAGRFPELEILKFIGRGGMGAVYQARQKSLNRLVAVKILPPEIGHQPAFTERFAREAQAMARLNHPNIVTIYEFGERQGLFFFMMEFVDGVTLRHLLGGERISPREALAIVPQICDALQYAHDQGIVHRDIKPENILLDRQGRVKVADFGLAKLMAAAEGETPAQSSTTDASATVAAVGTPSYMAPEQSEQPGKVDHRADIYALGVVFYQMLTGELPDKQIVPPSQRVQIDVRLDQVVLRALQRQPELRYNQVSEVKTLVETITNTPAASRQPIASDLGKPEGAKSPTAFLADPKTRLRKVVLVIIALSLCLMAVKVVGAQIRRMSFTAGFNLQSFVINQETAEKLTTDCMAVPLPDSDILQLEMGRDAFLQLKEQAQKKPSTSPKERQLDVSVWSKTKDVWEIGGPNFVTRWTGSLGVGRKGDALKACLDYDVTVALRGINHVKLHYNGIIPFSKVTVFLLPVPQANGTTSFVVMGVQVDCGKMLGKLSSGTYYEVFCLQDENNVLFALYHTRRGDWDDHYSYDKLRPAILTIGAQTFNLHNGSLIILSEDGTMEQCPIFPTLDDVRDSSRLARLAETRAKRFRAKCFGRWMSNVIYPATEATSQIFLDLDTGKFISAPKEIQALMNIRCNRNDQPSQFAKTEKEIDEKIDEWARQSGADLMVDTVGANASEVKLAMYGGIASSVNYSDMIFYTPYQTLQETTTASDKQEKLPQSSKSQPLVLQDIHNVTMVFRTREGNAGILQARKNDGSSNSRGISLSYHLVQPLPPASVTLSTESLPDVQPLDIKKKWPDAAEIKLAAINDHPSWTGWWRPDGSSAGGLSFKDDGFGLVRSDKDWMPRYVALDISKLPFNTSELILRADSDVGRIEDVNNLDLFLVKDGGDSKFVPAKLHRCGMAVPRLAKTITLRVGVRFGPWETIATCAKDGTMTVNPMANEGIVPVSFKMKKYPRRLQALIGISPSFHWPQDGEMQVVAVTTDNRQIKGVRQSPMSHSATEMVSTWTFDKLSEKKVKEFQLQATFYHWIVFPNIPVQPAKTLTKPTFESLDDPESVKTGNPSGTP